MENTRQKIIDVGFEIAERRGLCHVTCAEIARKLKITHNAVLYHIKTVEALKSIIKDRAINEKNIPIMIYMALFDKQISS